MYPKLYAPYHNHHDIMTVGDGLILKGEALIIPPLEREKIQAIHKGHMGNHKVPVPCKTVYIGLESMKTSGKWLKHAQHANVIAHRNQDSHPNPQHQNAHGNT